MLERMRQSSQSLGIYLLFGIVIAVFIINFGPQSQGSSCEQTMVDENFAAKVSGETITSATFRYGFMLLGGAQVPAKYAKQEKLKETVLDKLIERELLATEADRLGFAVTEDEVLNDILDSRIIGLGQTVSNMPRVQKNGHFDLDTFKKYVQFELGVTQNAFIEEQKKEVLANRVRELVRSSVSVSAEEVKNEYLRKNRQVNLEYMRFVGRRFDAEVAPTEADIAEYAAKNEAKLRAAYDEKKVVYEKVPPQRRLRQILIKVASDAKPDVEKKAKTKAEALAEKIRKGAKVSGKEGVTFLEVARESSEDEATKGKGGDLGWRAKGSTNLTGENEDKVWSAKAGAIVGPLRGAGGFVITKVEGAREGEISFDKAKLELAEEKLREEQANAKAKAAAEAALAKAKASTTSTLKTLFPPASDADESATTAAPPSAPRVEETGLFALRATREGTIVEGIGISAPLAKAAFALTNEAPLAGPFEVGGSFVVVRLKERKEPDLAELERRKLELLREAEQAKSDRVLTDWTHARCVEAKKAKQIVVNTELLRYEDSTETPAYEPCTSHRMFGD
jgi:peptidyl-prolyl cis-trans isomerase D